MPLSGAAVRLRTVPLIVIARPVRAQGGLMDRTVSATSEAGWVAAAARAIAGTPSTAAVIPVPPVTTTAPAAAAMAARRPRSAGPTRRVRALARRARSERAMAHMLLPRARHTARPASRLAGPAPPGRPPPRLPNGGPASMAAARHTGLPWPRINAYP